MNNTELTLDQLRRVSAAGFRDSLGYKDRTRNLEYAKDAHISAADKVEQAMNCLLVEDLKDIDIDRKEMVSQLIVNLRLEF